MPGKSKSGNLFTLKFLLPIIGFIIIAALVYNPVAENRFSDPMCDLAVSQSIIEHGTIKLDPYKPRIYMEHHCIKQHNDHIYSLYPLGTPVFSLPFVAIALSQGKQMTHDRADHADLQRIIITIMVPVVFVIFYMTGLYFLPPLQSFILSIIAVLGTPIASSMGSGLWSHNYGVLFTAIAILLLVRYERGGGKLNAYLLGVILFCIYFSRPQFSFFILCTFIYLFLKDRRLLVKAGASSGILLLCFMAFSYHEYGKILPFYYAGSVWESGGLRLKSLFGILFAPSRGVITYSPYLLLLIALLVAQRKRIKSEFLFLIPLIWFMALYLLMSLELTWWSGGNYGPRRFVDIVPALTLLSFLLFEKVTRSEMKLNKVYAVYAAFLVLGALSIWIHTKQGLYNTWAANAWNFNPPLTEEAVFDWRYPQFYMDGELTRDRIIDYLGADRDKYKVVYDPKTDGLGIFMYVLHNGQVKLYPAVPWEER